jgi:cardiolipin synthase
MSGSFWGGVLLALVVVQCAGDLVDPPPPRPRPEDRLRRRHRQAHAEPVRADAGHRRGRQPVEVHENGAFFDVLVERIRAARHSVHFETFLWKDGTLGRRVAER